MPQTVLIVDDSLCQHELVRVLLNEQELRYSCAFDGVSAIAIAAAASPDLILLDVDLPDMNGFEVCRVLKSNAATAAIPVIFLTASTSLDEKVCGLTLRAVDYITKPFEPIELYVRVQAALRTKCLLDLLPGGKLSRSKSIAKGLSPYGASINERLSMAQLITARSQNPWAAHCPCNGVVKSTALVDELG